MNDFHDALETRDPATREAAQFASLRAQLAEARQHAPALAEALVGVDIAGLASRADLARVPVTRKPVLLERQKVARRSERRHDADVLAIFGGYSTLAWGAALQAQRRARKVFASPGPIYEPEGAWPDYWRMGRALFAAGFRAGDLVHNSFSYHLTPAGSMMESGAEAIGCTVFPAGVGQTELQLQAMADLRPDAYVGTPSFLRLLLEKAEEMKLALPSLTKAAVSGEACPAALRDWLAARGVGAYQSYGTADVGLVAYETAAREGLVVDEGVILEIVRPGTDEAVADGEVGEVVVTALNPGYPLLRFGTGDLSAVLPGACATGRTGQRIRGWLGRADQSAKVRGMFVHPSQVAEIVRRHGEIGRARLVVEGEMADDRMTLHAEVAAAGEGFAERVVQTIRDVTKLRGAVVLCAPSSLPNDGKVIDDRRRVG